MRFAGTAVSEDDCKTLIDMLFSVGRAHDIELAERINRGLGVRLTVSIRASYARALRRAIRKRKSPAIRAFPSGRRDSNSGPLVPQTSALTRLRHAPRPRHPSDHPSFTNSERGSHEMFSDMTLAESVVVAVLLTVCLSFLLASPLLAAAASDQL